MSEIVNSNKNMQANIQNVYSETMSFFKEFERTRELMETPLQDLLSSGKFDSMFKIAKEQYNARLKLLEKDKKFKGSKKEDAFKKYKKALELTEKFISCQSDEKKKNLNKFDDVSSKLTQAVDNNWRQTTINNTLNYFTEISYAFLDIETKFKMGEMTQYDAYNEIRRIKFKLDYLPVEDQSLSFPYQKLCIFATNYANAFKKPEKKDTDEKKKDDIKPTFCKYTIDWLNENTQTLHQLVGDMQRIGDKKLRQDTIRNRHTKDLYNNLHDVYYYIDGGNVDDVALDQRMTQFETVAKQLEEERVSESSESNVQGSDIKNIIGSMQRVTETFVEKSAKSTYEETAHRIENDKNLLDQINNLVVNGYPYEFAKMFFEYMQEKNICEVANIRNVEEFSHIPLTPELEKELGAYNARMAKNGLVKPLVKELKPTPMQQLEGKPTDSNGNPTYN